MLKWVHNNGFMNLSVVIIYLVVDSIIYAFSSSFKPFNPNRRVSTIIETLLFGLNGLNDETIINNISIIKVRSKEGLKVLTMLPSV